MRYFRLHSTHSLAALSLLFITLFAVSCRQTDVPNAPEDCCKGVVAVHVCDANGTFIPDALVCLMLDDAVIRSAHSDDSGNVRFGQVCEGSSYRLNVSKDG